MSNRTRRRGPEATDLDVAVLDELLAAMLVFPDGPETVIASGLAPGDFGIGRHCAVASMIFDTVRDDAPLDVGEISDRLAAADGDVAWFHGLINQTPARALLPKRIEQVRAMAERKKVTHAVSDYYDHGDGPRLLAEIGAAVAAGGPGSALALTIVTVQEFAATTEPGGEALLGTGGDNVIPAGGDVMVYGGGGSGKTTLSIDLGCHLCARLDWIGLTVDRALRGLIIENEGPRPNLRDKFKAKLAHWAQAADCPDLDDRFTIVEEPWAELRLDRAPHRQGLADEIRARGIDFVVIGPLATSGMVGHGTIEEARNFLACLADVRRRAGRPVAFIVVHHENSAGQVSGAWEGAGDTLIHVRKRDRGRTGLHVDKARWAPGWHGKTLELLWRDGERYEVEVKEELSDDDIVDKIVEALRENPGTGWTAVVKKIATRAERQRAVRDRLLADGTIVNAVKIDGVETALAECPERKTAHLYLATDPAVARLRPDPDADGTQMDFDLG